MNLPAIANAVTLQNGVPTTTSLKVAEIFGVSGHLKCTSDGRIKMHHLK